jgi:hypothetical protein
VITSNTPPIPIENAPIAKELTSGEKLAAVPVVPHRKLVTIIATTPLKLP